MRTYNLFGVRQVENSRARSQTGSQTPKPMLIIKDIISPHCTLQMHKAEPQAWYRRQQEKMEKIWRMLEEWKISEKSSVKDIPNSIF